jgi:hypothetical protein
VRVSFAGALVALALLVPTSASAASEAYGTVYWSPGYCKTMLQRYGIRIDDGRRFWIAKAFCVGRGGTECEWDETHSRRDYRSFWAISRSYDGNLRTFTLWVTGRENYRVTEIKLVGYQKNPYRFNFYGQQAARVFAQREHEKGCMAYQG